MEIIYWSIRLSSRRGVDGVKGMDGGRGGYRYFSPQQDHENLVQHPSNK